MGLMDLFNPVESVSPDEVRTAIKTRKPDEYSLLDVRQPQEYEQVHLPGAMLIPLGELSVRLGELDKGKKYYVYCRSGNRSRSAVGLMAGQGFGQALNMDGGIDAYNGKVASGSPEAGMFCFPETLSPAQLVAVAWLLEDGSQRFYRGIREQGGSAAELVGRLIESEEGHKASLAVLYKDISGQEPGQDFPSGVMDLPGEDMMEGCVVVDKALAWASGREALDVLELMMALESNALDLYLKLARRSASDEARKVYTRLSDEEVKHLKYLAEELTALL